MGYVPVLEIYRGEVLEALHHGAIAVVEATGRLVSWVGDPETIVYTRSAAKPFQVLPFLEQGGQAFYRLSEREIALMCASHSGTDKQVATLEKIQKKVAVSEADLLCGVHYPMHSPTALAMRVREEQPTSNRHNCSGKHTAMLAFANQKRLQGEYLPQDVPYISLEHPIQQSIMHTFAEMCDVQVDRIVVGIDGCSVPNFAVPLRNVALAYARLADPQTGGVEPTGRVDACHLVASAMMSNPDMVGGPGRFDTRLMEVCQGRILLKAGAEGYQGICIMPDALGRGSPALGIAIKIADGDRRKTIRPAVVLELLRQLGAISRDEMDRLEEFGPAFPVLNWRKIVVGQAMPVFTLEK